MKGLFRQEIGSLQPGPDPGDAAPDFTLKTVDGNEEVQLSKLIGGKPVVLVFGNFTCGPFRSQAGNVEKLYRRYKDRATFVMVYVREAHPTDGWHMSTHAGAMLIAALAYRYARRHARNARFTFGTGKMGDLAGFASAVILALIALLIGWESLMRFYSPVAISFRQAIFVAVIGLIVNLICAWLLREDHAHHHHGHSH